MKEQIEEMAKIIAVQRGYDCASHENCEESCIVYRCNPYAYAEILYNAGYRKQSEWISVTERMPPALGKVLVYSPILGVYMTCYTAYSPRFAEESVTHWMPLPEPPEKKGGAE